MKFANQRIRKNMSKEVVVGGSSTSDSEVLDSLKSRYPCIHDPSSSAADTTTPPDHDDSRYLTSLCVFGNRQVDGPESPLPPSFSNLMVDPNIIDPQMIKEKITSALKVIRFRDQRVLVQFWSPVAVRKRWLLTTWDQPFGLGVADKGLYLHRLKSELRAIVIDGEHHEELAPPGRVFSQKLPEWYLDVHGGDTYSDVYGYIDLPVFESNGDFCVGILEIITSSNYVDYAFEVQEVSRALKKQNLKSPNVLEDPSFCKFGQVVAERRQHELDEIFKALQSICDIHNIPLAQMWAVSACSSCVANYGNLEQSCSSFNRSCIGKVCMSTAELPFYVRDLSKWEFRKACKEKHLEKSRGVVGRSLASCGALFCGDVTKLDEDDYPLAPLARMNGLTSCLAIYLKSHEVDVEYVIEFFLAPRSANKIGLRRLMETVKQLIKSTSCMQSDIISFPHIIGEYPSNWNLESPHSAITLLTEKGERPPSEPENVQSFAKDIQKDVDVIFPKKQSEVAYMELDNLENEPSNSAVAGTSRSVVPYLEKGVEDSDFNSGKTKRTYSVNSKGTRRKRKRAESSISLEEITKYFGKTMDEAAAILEISRSTLKRLCRDLGIPRWPYKSGPDKNNSHNQSDVVIHGKEEALTSVFRNSSVPLGTTSTGHDLTENGKHSSTFELRHEPTKSPDGCTEPETSVREKLIETNESNTVENVTIKATYGDNIMKFSFGLLDGLVKLEELVATRFQLRHGSFSLKYVDEDGDMILIVCENDLTTAISDSFRHLDSKAVIRLFVQLVSGQISDA